MATRQPQQGNQVGGTGSVPPLRTSTSYISQAPFVGDVPPPYKRGVVSYTFFAQDRVKMLTTSDFALETKDKIALKWDNCLIVLFYGENAESKAYVQIWTIVAQQAAGPVMAACNLIAETQVARAFAELAGMGSHPLQWAAMKGYPFILVYRGGWPTAFYNGERSVQSLVDWSMTLACQANYYERDNYAGGVQVEAAFQMGPIKRYPDEAGKNPIRKYSDQYSTVKPVRGYNPNLPISYQGSPLAQKEIEVLQQLRDQQQGNGQQNQTQQTDQDQQQGDTTDQDQDTTDQDQTQQTDQDQQQDDATDQDQTQQTDQDQNQSDTTDQGDTGDVSPPDSSTENSDDNETAPIELDKSVGGEG